jgi:hypothetical protein
MEQTEDVFFWAMCRFSDEKLEMHQTYPKQENTQELIWREPAYSGTLNLKPLTE